ncbi:NADH-ubiquinone oxidoreductase chain H [hydrothermal vent metagenome]|uniref:NADH-ubiquinone oxidoreductase chain H n=1 Tax=hydrothermal vent metagenome TaxID=652676 RepID=A0A3B1CVZ6_9ZZZZ
MSLLIPSIIETVVKVAMVFGMNMGFFAPMLGWVERKQSAMMQDRIGANRAAVFGFTVIGLFHSLADAIKLIFKEDFVPRGADVVLHRLAPAISLIPALIAFTVIPFGGQYTMWGHNVNLVVADLDVGVLFVFAISSLATFGVVVGGWASNNNWSLLGALRASAQMFAYEVAMGFTIISLIMYYQSLSLVDIVAKQESILHWGIVWHWPAFLLFFTCAVAENKRVPFDIPEAESELVAGYFTEYSGMKFIMFWTAEFVEIVTIGALCVVLFFGGHHIPFVPDASLVTALGFLGDNLANLAAAVIALLVFTLKVIVFIFIQMTIRWTLPRFRYDQIMRLGWKMVLPASLLWIFISGAMMLSGIMPTP